MVHNCLISRSAAYTNTPGKSLGADEARILSWMASIFHRFWRRWSIWSTWFPVVIYYDIYIYINIMNYYDISSSIEIHWNRWVVFANPSPSRIWVSDLRSTTVNCPDAEPARRSRRGFRSLPRRLATVRTGEPDPVSPSGGRWWQNIPIDLLIKNTSYMNFQ